MHTGTYTQCTHTHTRNAHRHIHAMHTHTYTQCTQAHTRNAHRHIHAMHTGTYVQCTQAHTRNAHRHMHAMHTHTHTHTQNHLLPFSKTYDKHVQIGMDSFSLFLKRKKTGISANKSVKIFPDLYWNDLHQHHHYPQLPSQLRRFAGGRDQGRRRALVGSLLSCKRDPPEGEPVGAGRDFSDGFPGPAILAATKIAELFRYRCFKKKWKQKYTRFRKKYFINEQQNKLKQVSLKRYQ